MLAGIISSTLGIPNIIYDVTFDNVSYVGSYPNSTNGKDYDIYNINTAIGGKTYQVLHLNDTDDTTLTASLNSHPGADLCEGSTSSYKYNCHAFAWLYDGKVSRVPTSSDNLFWVNDPTPFLEGTYKCVSSYGYYDEPSTISDASFIHVGDIIIYCNPFDPELNDYYHSAVVISASSNINNIRVRSKWSFLPVYEHNIFDGYAYAAAGYRGGIYYPESNMYICHVNHSCVYDTLNVLYHYCYTICCGRTFKANHNYTLVGNRYICSECGYISFYEPYGGGEVDI